MTFEFFSSISLIRRIGVQDQPKPNSMISLDISAMRTASPHLAKRIPALQIMRSVVRHHIHALGITQQMGKLLSRDFDEIFVIA